MHPTPDEPHDTATLRRARRNRLGGYLFGFASLCSWLVALLEPDLRALWAAVALLQFGASWACFRAMRRGLGAGGQPSAVRQ